MRKARNPLLFSPVPVQIVPFSQCFFGQIGRVAPCEVVRQKRTAVVRLSECVAWPPADLPPNRFKAALKAGTHQLDIWNTIGGNTVPEALASCGFDWVLVDTEHAAIETIEVLPALKALEGYPTVSAAVRPAANDPVLIKRLLDMGAQTLLVPYDQCAE